MTGGAICPSNVASWPTITAGNNANTADFNTIVTNINGEVTRRGSGTGVSGTSAGTIITTASEWATMAANVNAWIGSGLSFPGGNNIAASGIQSLMNNAAAAMVICLCNCNYACTCVCNYACTCVCNYCTCNCNYCTCNCNYCTCNCNYACTCVCNYACTCVCNYACTCNCNYTCTCNCNYSPSCFLAGSKVTMADGTDKPIENIVVGDVIYSYDVPDKEFNVGKVHALSSPESDEVYSLVLSDGTTMGVTADHPIFTTHGWAAIEPKVSLLPDTTQLCVGDTVMKIDGTHLTVKSFTLTPGTFKTYTLVDVENFDTFFVNNILVHNKGCFPAGTLITMADGSKKKVEEIQVGDSVLSYDETNHCQVSGLTEKTLTHLTEHICTITFENFEPLMTTKEHPLHTEDGWKSIDPSQSKIAGYALDCGKLEVGDLVLTVENTLAKVLTISTEPSAIVTFNLNTVSPHHNFYAGGILVHNK